MCRFSGDLPGYWHAEAGHAVDHLAGDPGFDLLGGQTPGSEAPAEAQPLTVVTLLGLPFALGGGILSLVLRGMPFSRVKEAFE